MGRKPTELRPLMTRIPEALRRRLEKEAARNDRSMNAEIVHRLQESLKPKQMDICTYIQNTMEKVRSEHGEDPEFLLPQAGRAIGAFLEMLLPDLHSLQIKTFTQPNHPDATYEFIAPGSRARMRSWEDNT